jgi:hypothetical protein
VAARQIGTARRNADGAIIVKLDPGEIVRSGALFLYPVQQNTPDDCGSTSKANP